MTNWLKQKLLAWLAEPQPESPLPSEPIYIIDGFQVLAEYGRAIFAAMNEWNAHVLRTPVYRIGPTTDTRQ